MEGWREGGWVDRWQMDRWTDLRQIDIVNELIQVNETEYNYYSREQNCRTLNLKTSRLTIYIQTML